jgi:tetratricopeptide (TPR) repeat protein
MPIHTEAVSAATGRAEPLALLIAAGFLLLHRSRRSPLLAALLFFLALLAKESAIAFLPLAIWLDACLPRTRKRWPYAAYGAYAAAAALWLALRAHALRGGSDPVAFLDNPAWSAGALSRILTAARVQVEYLRREILPTGLSSDYSYDQIPLITSPGHPGVIAFALVTAAAALVAWRCRHRQPAITFAIGGCAVLAFPTSNFALPIVTLMAERLAYGPSVFTALLLGMGAARLRPRAPRVIAGAVLALLLFYGGVTIARNRTWANEEVFYRAQLQSAPRSAKAWYNRGRYFDETAQPDSALAHYQSALRILPGYWAAWNNVGLIHAARGDLALARDAYRRAIEAWPEYALAHYNLGLLQLRQGKFEDAARSLETVLRIQPAHARALANLGGAYYRLGRSEAAVEAWERALQLDPANQIARTNLELVRGR